MNFGVLSISYEVKLNTTEEISGKIVKTKNKIKNGANKSKGCNMLSFLKPFFRLI